MGLASGSKLGTYEIRSSLGAGGMGEVYRATDTKLGRDVALKVLPAEMAQDAERLARFRREAKVLAQLDHPNIVTIYSVEECDGVHFLTMQLVDGQPLDRLILQDGLSLERIVEIGSALADALAAAHEKGIVHRDLKPANVMVSNEGRVKVLDFGLAKDVRGSNLGDATMTSDSRTQVGVVMGTPAYMSPEQTSGRPLDHRTDIFSLGVVLHEMSTGHRPFEGSSSAELVSSILRDTPTSVTDVRPELPTDLARVIRRCLEKDPRHRLQTARDVSNEFRDLVRTTTRPASISTSRAREAAKADSGSARTDEGFWVAVLPFKYSGGNADLASLADGLTDDITTGFSKFSYLRVIARSSSSRYAGHSVDVRAAGKELNARYVMEGTLRQAGNKLRLAAQLVDTVSGAHLWAENYERAFSVETIFELQDDLVPRIVSTVADMNGVLPRSMSEGLRSRTPEQLSPYEAVLRSFAYTYSATPEELTAARLGLEEAVRKAPNFSDAWAMLSFLCGQDYVHGYELQADAMATAVSAARRAVALGPSNHLAYFSLGQALWLQRDYDSFRDAVERAVGLNPMDGNSVAYLGELLVYAGGTERGMQLVGRAKQLNPNHPGWYWFADFYHAFSQEDYRGAQSFALKAKMRGNPLAPMFLAAACGQLGDLDAGTNAVADLLKFRPELPALMRKQVAKVWNPEYGERFLKGLSKAGIKIPASSTSSARVSTVATAAQTASGESRTDEGFWVAVLPFKHKGADAAIDALAEGITEEIITGMSRFPYLHVIAHGSTLRYANQAADLRQVGKELGARYVMEGSLRLSGSRVRIAAQLIDASSGSQLWAETYDRTLQPEAIFELQDEVVPRIVSTVGDTQGILAQSMSEAVWNKEPGQLTPYEAVLRSFSYMRRVNAPNHAAARDALEDAVKQAPGNGLAWAMLAIIFREEYNHGFNLRPDALGRALDAARRAVEAEPSNYLAHHALASVQFYRRELEAFRSETQRALQLNPMDGFTFGYLGMLTAFAGDWDRGCSMSEKARSVNPEHPGWYWFAPLFDAFRKQEYRLVLELAQKVNMPNFWRTNIALAATYGHLGETGPGRKALQRLLAARPEFATSAQEECKKWWTSELVDQIMEGLRKAGLDSRDVDAATSISAGTEPPRTASGESRVAEGFWVAVLPFRYAGNSEHLKALAEGLSEEVITGLSRFSYLRVIARGSTAKYSSESGDVRAIGKELAARYVMEGSIRPAGTKVRIAVQLVDAGSGAGLWAETYDRPFQSDSTLDLLDEVVPRIVCTVADTQGILAHSMTEALRNRDPETLTPYEAVLRSFGHHQRVNAAEHLAARTALENAVKQPPDRADCWAMLAWLYREEYTHGFNLQPDPLGRALAASRRALDAGPSNHLAQAALASTLFFLHDLPGFRAGAERAIVLNPLEGYTLAYLGMLIAYSGDWERGCALADRARQLNSNHPGWYWFPRAFNAYRQRDYRGAVETALKVNMPGFWRTQLLLAAANGQLGDQVAAGNAVQELLRIRPNFRDLPQDELRKWHDEELKEHLLDGLRKAGLDARGSAAPVLSSGATPARAVSGETHADEGFWVAVLPFRYTGDDRSLKALAEGLSEEIITGLSRFSYLRVIARGSTAKYSSEAGDVREIGKELAARYVMEGGLRQAGSKLRVAVQLVDTVSGAHLWAETYEHAFTPESMFDVQDDLVPRIVATVADQYGVLPRSMSEVLRNKSEDALTPHEAVLRTFSYFTRMNPEEHAVVRAILERAVREAPDHADSWAMLSMIYRGEFAQGYNAQPNPLDRALAAAQRAIDLAPMHALSHYALATVYFFRKDKVPFRVEAERGLALNPYDAGAKAYLGLLIASAGEWDKGCEMVESAMRLNPNCPGYFYFARCWGSYRLGKYEETLEAIAHANTPNYFHVPAIQAAALGQLGRLEEAQKAVQHLLALRPDFAATARQEYGKWYDEEHVEQVIEGLRKAGLEIPEAAVSPAKDLPTTKPPASS